MLQVKTTQKGEKTYNNIDFRDMDDGETVELELAFDKPFTGQSTFGTWYSYTFKYGEQQVSAFISPSMKTLGYRRSFHRELVQYTAGDKLLITKGTQREEGKREFRYWNIEKVGGTIPSTAQTQDLNPNPGATQEGQLVLTADEKTMVDELKTNVTLETNKLDIVKVLVKQGVIDERARQIVERFF